jgi:hypothetical protein
MSDTSLFMCVLNRRIKLNADVLLDAVKDADVGVGITNSKCMKRLVTRMQGKVAVSQYIFRMYGNSTVTVNGSCTIHLGNARYHSVRNPFFLTVCCLKMCEYE